MKPTIDSILFGLVQKNNTKAFSELYKRYWSALYRSIYLRTGDENVSKEIVEDVFVCMWEKRSFIHIGNSCSQYLLRETKHRIMDWAVEENILAEDDNTEGPVDTASRAISHTGEDFNASLSALRKRLLEWFDSFQEGEIPDELEMQDIETEILVNIFDSLRLEIPVVEIAGKKQFVFPELALRVVTAIMVLIILGGIWELFSR